MHTQIASRADQAVVRAAGIGWRDYDRFMQKRVKRIGDERLTKVSPTATRTGSLTCRSSTTRQSAKLASSSATSIVRRACQRYFLRNGF
jgi:hypothetical protein